MCWQQMHSGGLKWSQCCCRVSSTEVTQFISKAAGPLVVQGNYMRSVSFNLARHISWFSFHHSMMLSSRFIHRPVSWRFVQRAGEGAGPQPASREEAPLVGGREAALLLVRAIRQQGAVSRQVSRPQQIHVSWRGTGRGFAQTGLVAL